jgi:prepilin-type N-terminal cleavage/methylation domain-containing protein
MVNFKMKILNERKAVTLFEVMIALGLFTILMLAAYRLFFAEVRSIKSVLEHIGVNENARRFFAHLGNDIRNSAWLDYPEQTNRQTVPALMAVNEGKVCVLRQQFFDFEIKPPDPAFLREQIIEYHLEKCKDGTSDLYRIVKSNLPGAKKEHRKKICEGIREMLVYVTNRKPATLTGFAAGMPFKNLLTYEPYELDGTGPYLVHVRATFVRKNQDDPQNDQAAHQVKSCFCIRGKLNGVHP